MRPDSLQLDSTRTKELTLENYPFIHERHRIFPQIFENRKHKKILDITAGIGYFAKIITENYKCEMTCNEVDPNCINQLKKLDVKITSYDIDTGKPLPFADGAFDTILCLATLEHLIHIDFFTQDLFRILADDGFLYFSVPNYASLYQLIPIIKGRTFHDPFGERSRYEFYAHIRYFTYHTIKEYMEHFGFEIDTVYLPIPKGSNKFKEIKKKSKILAFTIQKFFSLLYHISPRWHQEPIICFKKALNRTPDTKKKVRKVLL